MNLQKGRLQHDMLQKSYRRAEQQMLATLKRRKAEVKVNPMSVLSIYIRVYLRVHLSFIAHLLRGHPVQVRRRGHAGTVTSERMMSHLDLNHTTLVTVNCPSVRSFFVVLALRSPI